LFDHRLSKKQLCKRRGSAAYPGSEHLAWCPLLGGAASGSFCDFVIPLPKELNKTEPVTEWISHECEPAPLEGNDVILKLRSARNGLLHYGFDFLYDKIEMDRRPMAFVATKLRGCLRRRRTGSFDQQIDWGRTAKHLDPERAETAADLQPEHRAVEADGLFEIVNVKVYETVHLT
jgi:hypothetical protein